MLSQVPLPALKHAALSAWSSALVISASQCQILHAHASIKHDAANAVYFLQLIDSSVAIDGGGAITPIAIKEVNHKQNEAETFEFDFPCGGIYCASGCVLQLSTTLGTGTLATSNLLAYACYL